MSLRTTQVQMVPDNPFGLSTVCTKVVPRLQLIKFITFYYPYDQSPVGLSCDTKGQLILLLVRTKHKLFRNITKISDGDWPFRDIFFWARSNSGATTVLCPGGEKMFQTIRLHIEPARTSGDCSAWDSGRLHS